MTDYHGFICNDDTNFDIVDVLKAASIGALHFSASINSQMSSHFQSEDDGVLMDLAAGAESWRAERDGSYRRHLKSNRRRIRKAGKNKNSPRPANMMCCQLNGQ